MSLLSTRKLSPLMIKKLKHIDQGGILHIYKDKTLKALQDRGLVYIDGDSEANADEGPLLKLTELGNMALTKLENN